MHGNNKSTDQLALTKVIGINQQAFDKAIRDGEKGLRGWSAIPLIACLVVAGLVANARYGGISARGTAPATWVGSRFVPYTPPRRFGDPRLDALNARQMATVGSECTCDTAQCAGRWAGEAGPERPR
jgi:hypothetical protein